MIAYTPASPGWKRFIVCVFVLAVLGFGAALWAFWIEPARTVFRETTLEMPGLPPGLEGMRVAVLADLHVGAPHVPLERLERIVAATNAAGPDLILLAGDYVIQGVAGGRPVAPEDIFPVLDRLEAPLGVYAVMGNHDWWHGYRAIVAAFEAGAPTIRLLEDRGVVLTRGGASFGLLGITDYTEGPMAYQSALQDLDEDFVMAVTHSPDVFPDLPASVDLTFAGHTHGGQVLIPLLGRPLVPSDYGDRYAIGTIREGGKTLFVSVGVGTSILPVRFLVPPEVNLVTLISPEA